MPCYNRIPKREWKPMKITGVKPHPRTGILWLRLRTPAHLINRRETLESLGVRNFHIEHHRSLGTRDRGKAESAYAVRRNEIQQIWDTWETVLLSGPQALSYKNITALAGERAKAFFKTHEDDPFSAPLDIQIPELPLWSGPIKDLAGALIR